MKRKNITKIWLAPLVAMLAVPVASQSKQDPARPKPLTAAPVEKKTSILKHNAVIGAEVFSAKADDAELGKSQALARISDIVIDCSTGQLRFAALGVGKKQVEVPWSQLTWDAQGSRFTTKIDKEALEKMPEFDAKKHGPAAGAADAKVEKKDQGTERDATGGGRDSDVKGGAASPASGTHTVLASKIGACAVLARGEELGSCDALFVEPASGRAAFLTVAAGGAAIYVIPWDALKPAKAAGAQKLEIEKTRKDLENAPKLGDQGADVSKAEFRTKVYTFYGVKPPAFERVDARAK